MGTETRMDLMWVSITLTCMQILYCISILFMSYQHHISGLVIKFIVLISEQNRWHLITSDLLLLTFACNEIA